MKRFEIDWSLNTFGVDTLELIYDGINEAYPELELTKENSSVTLVQGWGDPSLPNTAIIRIQRGLILNETYDFLYDRQDINDVLEQPVFDADDLIAIQAIDNSAELLEYIAVKHDIQIDANDVWVSINSIDNTGGTVQPNWYIRTRYDSLGWCGDITAWLHPGP